MPTAGTASRGSGAGSRTGPCTMRGVRARGGLTVWFSEEAVAAWRAEARTTRGGQPRYSALAITTALTLRAASGWWRSTAPSGAGPGEKLHLATDADTGQIVAAELTDKDADDGSRVGPLLDQVEGRRVLHRRRGVRPGRRLRRGRGAPSRCGRRRAAALERGAERHGRDRTDAARPRIGPSPNAAAWAGRGRRGTTGAP